MISGKTVVVFSGSSRNGSLNIMLAKAALCMLDSRVYNLVFINLGDYMLPLYDGDIESTDGIPENALRLHDVMQNSVGFIITSPEYNGLVSPLLKNTVDWLSRPLADSAIHSPFRRKFVLLMAASPGKFGGIRGLQSARQLFANLGAVVVPEQLALPYADKAFDGEGRLIDEKQVQQVKALADRFVGYLPC